MNRRRFRARTTLARQPDHPDGGQAADATRSPRPGRDLKRLMVHLADFWVREYSLSVFCLFVLLSTIASISLARVNIHGGRIAYEIILAMVLVSGVMAISGNRRTLIMIASLSVLTVASQVAVTLAPNRFGSIWITGLLLLNMSLLAAVMLAHAFRNGPVTLHRIQGAVGSYLLLGLVWAHAYLLIEILSPGSFSFSSGTAEDSTHLSMFSYLSFTTLTTLGYGDCTASNPFARSLCMTEALVGQLYPAILIARLVSTELQSRPAAPDIRP